MSSSLHPRARDEAGRAHLGRGLAPGVLVLALATGGRAHAQSPAEDATDAPTSAEPSAPAADDAEDADDAQDATDAPTSAEPFAPAAEDPGSLAEPTPAPQRLAASLPARRPGRRPHELAWVASSGMGSLDRRHDFVGQDPPWWDAVRPPPYVVFHRPYEPPPRAPVFAMGLAYRIACSERLSVAATTDVLVGPTHPFTTPILRVPADFAGGNAFRPRVAFAFRSAVTVRLALGARRRGFVGVGERIGARFRIDRQGTYFWSTADPDAPPITAESFREVGLTVEALAETGVRLGANERVTLAFVGGAGRPLWRAELALAVRLGGSPRP